jgi:hypothetical protein
MSAPYPRTAWINGRHAQRDSLFYGEVGPEVDIWQNAGPPSPDERAIGQISHATRITVLTEEKMPPDDQRYYQISSNEIQGWVPESFISWRWSFFTFLGTLSPSEACSMLDVQLGFGGMEMLIKQNGFAILTEGDPSHFDSIRFAILRFADRIVNAQVPLTTIAVKADISNWVEVPLGDEPRTVGFLSKERQTLPISIDQIEIAHSIVPLMSIVPYLDLALSDLAQALHYPQHALIFLARAIESIENYFGESAKKGVGKEAIMQESLGLEKADVEYITRRANTSHRRHASREAKAIDLSQEELAECFQKTSKIITAFVTFLGKADLS